MEDKEAIEILMKLLEKNSLSKEEKEAIRSAIGILSWSKLGKSRIASIKRSQKSKRDKDIQRENKKTRRIA